MKAKGLLWAAAIVFAYLASWIITGAWNIWLDTVTSEVTGSITKRASLLPLFLLVILAASITIVYVTKKYAAAHWLFFGLIALLALLLRATWVTVIPTIPVSDFEVYHEMAIDLARGQLPEHFKPLGYPILLSLAYRVFPDAVSGRILNVILGMATVLLVYWAGRQISDANGGLLAMLWMALSPSEIFMTSVLGSEVANACFSFGAIAVLLYLLKCTAQRGRNHYFLPGLLLGFATIIRPTSILLVFVLILLLYLKRTIDGKLFLSMRIVAGVLVFPILIVAWTSYGWHQFSLKSLFSDNFTLLSGTNIDYDGFYSTEDSALFFSFPADVRSQKVVETAKSRLRAMDAAELGGFVAGKIQAFLTDNRYGLQWAFYVEQPPLSVENSYLMKTWLNVIAQSWYVLALVGTALAILRSIFVNDDAATAFFCLIVVAVLPHILLEVQSRYHHLLLPVFSLATGMVCWRLVRRLREDFLANWDYN